MLQGTCLLPLRPVHVANIAHVYHPYLLHLQAIIVLSQEHEFPSAGYAQWIVRKGGFEATTSLLQVNMGD